MEAFCPTAYNRNNGKIIWRLKAEGCIENITRGFTFYYPNFEFECNTKHQIAFILRI
jgi:hypothetical protein